MNKFTKISATALVALFLAACDKPADKAPADKAPAAAEPAKTTETAKPAETQAPAADAAKPADAAPAAEAPKAVEAPSDAAKADFQKILDWNAAQEKDLAASQAALQEKLATKDPKQIQEGLTGFNAKVADVVKSLDGIEVADEQIKSFKEKTKQVLMLSSEVIAEQVKTMETPNDQNLVQALQQKAQTLIEAGTELQKLNVELQQRFMAK